MVALPAAACVLRLSSPSQAGAVPLALMPEILSCFLRILDSPAKLRADQCSSCTASPWKVTSSWSTLTRELLFDAADLRRSLMSWRGGGRGRGAKEAGKVPTSSHAHRGKAASDSHAAGESARAERPRADIYAEAAPGRPRYGQNGGSQAPPCCPDHRAKSSALPGARPGRRSPPRAIFTCRRMTSSSSLSMKYWLKRWTSSWSMTRNSRSSWVRCGAGRDESSACVEEGPCGPRARGRRSSPPRAGLYPNPCHGSPRGPTSCARASSPPPSAGGLVTGAGGAAAPSPAPFPAGKAVETRSAFSSCGRGIFAARGDLGPPIASAGMKSVRYRSQSRPSAEFPGGTAKPGPGEDEMPEVEPAPPRRIARQGFGQATGSSVSCP